jgi:cysteine desulfurase
VSRIYLDYAATTPVDRRVLAAMEPFWKCANAAAHHQDGAEVRDRVTRARATIAKALGVGTPSQIVFTSGATEADNLAIKGYADANQDIARIITSATEHKAVLESAYWCSRYGAALQVLPVDIRGQVDPQQVWDTAKEGDLVSVMAVNNETGVVAQLSEIASACRERGALFHCDAAQAVGRIPLDCSMFDMVSFSAHKIHGPKGVGALFVRSGVEIAPQMHGGRQEHGRRAGTTNAPLIVGFAQATKLAVGELDDGPKLQKLRSTLLDAVRDEFPTAVVNAEGVPAILNLGFPGIDDQKALLAAVCERVSCTGGSACSDGKGSHVLAAMQVELVSIRVSFGRGTTEAQAATAGKHIGAVAAAQR